MIVISGLQQRTGPVTTTADLPAGLHLADQLIRQNMQRRKPFSAKQRKAQLQQKRAVKRGDISPPPPASKQDRHRKGKRAPASSTTSAAVDSSRRLQSAFVKLPQKFLDHTKQLSSSIPLERPIPSELLLSYPSIFSEDAENLGAYGASSAQLTCPKRPKWRYDMSKEEVEKNEEGWFKKWLQSTDETVNSWFRSDLELSNAAVPPSPDLQEEPLRMPSAPASFERNLEVWRQLSVFQNILAAATIHLQCRIDGV